MKFAVLSLNPGIDRVLYLPGPMAAGGMNRLSRSVTSQGSKGANVAIMLHRLGCEVEYYAFSGGYYGEICRSFTDKEGIPSFFVETSAGVRLNTKVIDGNGVCTELNERGGPFSMDEAKKLISLFEKSDADVVCLCGSIPQGVENYVYNLLITAANARGKKTVLDCDGLSFLSAISARPSLIKPNLYELDTFGLSTGMFGNFSTDAQKCREQVADACGIVVEKYGCDVLCTLGGDGSIAALRSPEGRQYFDCPAAEVELKGFSGAGDCFLGAFIAAKYDRGMSNADALLFAAACGGAKVSLEGSVLPDAALVGEFFSRMRENGQPHRIAKND